MVCLFLVFYHRLELDCAALNLNTEKQQNIIHPISVALLIKALHGTVMWKRSAINQFLRQT